MTDASKKVTHILRIVNGSILTFQCVMRISSIVANSIIFGFEDYLPKGLLYIDGSEETFCSFDCGSTYTPKNLICCCCFDTTDNKLQIILDSPRPPLPPISQSEDCEYILIKISFKVLVNDLSALGSTLINYGEIYGNFWYEDSIGVYDIPIQYITLCDHLIEKYNFIVLGCSLNLPSNICCFPLKTIKPFKEFNEDFTAKFSFTALTGDYGDYNSTPFISTAKYVLTIRSTNGIKFPTTSTDFKKIEVSMDNQNLPFYPYIDDDNLIVEILHTGPLSTEPNNSSYNMSGKPILVTIPYEVCDCVTPPYVIKGSIDLIDIHSGKILVSLDNFCLYVNIQCPDLIGIGKNVLY